MLLYRKKHIPILAPYASASRPSTARIGGIRRKKGQKPHP